MKFKKIIAFILIGIFVFGFSNTKVQAAEITVTKFDVRLLSSLIYCEANGESYNGKLAVGIVVMNRKRSSLFPNTIKGVVYERYQFGPASNGSLKRALSEYDKGNFTSTAEKQCIKAAKVALQGAKSITVNSTRKRFTRFLFFSVGLRNYSYQIQNHRFR